MGPGIAVIIDEETHMEAIEEIDTTEEEGVDIAEARICVNVHFKIPTAASRNDYKFYSFR